MFKITPVQDIALAKVYLEACGASMKDDAFVYAMIDVDTQDIMGISQFEILGEYGYIFDLKPKIGLDDFEAMFILGRQTMNFIDICGSSHCRASLDAAEESLLKAIGFKQSDNYYECCTEGMFDGSHCSGGHK